MKKYIKFVPVVLFGVALVLWASINALTHTVELFGEKLVTTYSFINLTFGYSETIFNNNVQIFTFSFVNLLPLVFLIVALLFSGYFAFAAKPTKNVLLKAVPLILSLVAIVLTFFTKDLAVGANSIDAKESLKDFNYTIGTYIMVVLIALGGLSSFFNDK